MTDATHLSSGGAGDPGDEPMLDQLLREAVPEIKLALGDRIDRDNARAIPDRYARILPEATLVVTLRPDAAEALRPVADELERELTDSCMRHGSLYDRAYRVQLRAADDAGAPLFRVGVSTGGPEWEETPEGRPAAPEPAPAENRTEAAPFAPPAVDPDATRVEGVGPPAGWEPGRWTLRVEDEHGDERASLPLDAPTVTVGRRSDDPALRSDLMLDEAPHVSRRQLALAWAPRDGEPGFRVWNLGLNKVTAGEAEIPGANVRRGPLRLDDVAGEHAGWLAPGEPLTIGEHGPVLRLREAEPAEDPDATRLG